MATEETTETPESVEETVPIELQDPSDSLLGGEPTVIPQTGEETTGLLGEEVVLQTEFFENPEDDVTEETAEEETTEDVAEVDENLDPLGDDLRARAREYFEPEELAAYDDADLLARHLDIIEAKVPKEETVSETEEDEDDDIPALEIALDKDTFEPELVEAVDSLVKYANEGRDREKAYKAENKRLKAELAGLHKTDTDDKFDDLISAKGDKWHSALGKGKTHTLGKSGKSYLNREQVRSEMETLAAGYRSQGKPIPAAKDLFDRALRSALPEALEAITRAELKEQVSERSKNHINRPGGKKSPAPKTAKDREARALANLTARMGEKGFLIGQ